MAWVRIDDGVPHHPKFLQAGPAAAWLWVCAVAYSQRQLTDGFVPQAAVPTLGVTNARKLLDRLVAVGLMEHTALGWTVHDYLDHNDSRDVAIAKRAAMTAARSEAGRKGGLAKQTGSKPEKQTESKVEANIKQTGEAPSHPIPSQEERTKTSTAAPPLSAPKFPAHAAQPADDGNFSVILKLAHETMDASGLLDPSDPELLAKLKDACSAAKIDYGRDVDPDVCSRALKSAARARSALIPARKANGGLSDLVAELQDAPDQETLGKRIRAMVERPRR